MKAEVLRVVFAGPVADRYELRARVIESTLTIVRASCWVHPRGDARRLFDLTFRRSDGRQLLDGGALGG